MSQLFQNIRDSLDPGTVQQIGRGIGADPGTTQRAITAALPMLLGGMAQRAQGGGERDVQAAVESPAAREAAAVVMQPGTTPPPADPGMLSTLLGQKHTDVQQQVARTSGLDPKQAGKLLMYLAPVVIGVLARRQQRADGDGNTAPGAVPPAERPQAAQGDGDSGAGGGLLGSLGGLAGILSQAQGSATQHAEQSNPGLGQIRGGMFGR